MKKLMACFIVVFLCLSAASGYSENTISLVTMNWEPFYGKNLSEGGFLTAIVRETFHRAGYELVVKFVPWKRALELAKRGHYDGLLGAYYSEERNQVFYFTDSIAKSEEVFIQKKGMGISYTSLADLRKYTIGGLRGGAQTQYLTQNGLTVEESTDYVTTLKKLNAGRIDIVAVGRQYFNYILKHDNKLKEFQGAFDVIEPPFKSYELYCSITRKRTDGAMIIEKFNKALQEVKSDGTYDAILRRFEQK